MASTVGRDIYEKFVRNYTRKQWDLDPSELDAAVLARVAARTNRDDRSFTDRYQTLADATPGVHFVGRLATYRYYGMHQVVAQALATFEHIAGLRGPDGKESSRDGDAAAGAVGGDGVRRQPGGG